MSSPEGIVIPARVTVGGVEVSPRSGETLRVSQHVAAAPDLAGTGWGRSWNDGPGGSAPSVVGRVAWLPARHLPTVLWCVAAAGLLLIAMSVLTLRLLRRHRSVR